MQKNAKATLKPAFRVAPTKEVALVGFGQSMDLMWELPEHVDIWTLNASQDYEFPRQPAALFEIHPLEDIILETRRWAHLQQEHDYPIYVKEANPLIPSGIEYPVDAMSDMVFENIYLGDEHADYWDSTLPYMCAMAAYTGYKVVHICGFEFKSDTEYRYQRPGSALFIGWLGGKGIRVNLPENSALLPPTRYGYTEYQMISRQNFEQWIQVLHVEESDFQGKLNTWNARVQEREHRNLFMRLGRWIQSFARIDQNLVKAQDERAKAYEQMVMRGGAIFQCHQAIDVCDRKTAELEKVDFKDRYFAMAEGEEVDAEKVIGSGR